jgi:hypothetical protein
MNHSLYYADRTTHLKIVVMALLCATIVASVGIFARLDDSHVQITRVTQAVMARSATINGSEVT